MILASFIQGLTESRADVELIYASQLKVRPCDCGEMRCWYDSPGECYIYDDMRQLYPKLRAADILIFATPVYIPLPGAMQNVINRLCPLMDPYLESLQGRTRARFHKEVRIQKIVLVSTGGWWEKENFGTVVRIVEEFAENARVEYGGAILRPHASLMKEDDQCTKEGQAILDAVRKAGNELITSGEMSQTTLEKIRRPLIAEEELRHKYNQLLSNP